MVHLGLGSFFRAHRPGTPITRRTARTGGTPRSADAAAGLAAGLTAQDGLYTLVIQGGRARPAELISGLSAAHPAARPRARGCATSAAPDLAVVTVTVTEAGYHARAARRPGPGSPQVAADLEALRASPARRSATAPARLVAGLAARRRAGAGPLAIIPCDNLPANGALASRVLTELAEGSTRAWPPGSANR